MRADLYYRHSGQFSLSGVLLGWAAGLATGMVAGYLYAYADLYIPLIYANVFLCMIYGFLVGIVAARVMAWAKVRNPVLMRGVAAIAAMLGLYVCWAAWACGVLDRGDVELPFLAAVRNPRLLWRIMLAINEHGAWSLGSGRSSEPVTGLFLWIVWAAEAALILGAAVFAVGMVLSQPFCEACETWCKARKDVGSIAAGDPAELRQRLEAKDFTCLEKLGPRPAAADSWVRFDLHSCPGCGQTHTLTAKLVTISVDKKGKHTQTEKIVVDRLLLAPTEMETFLATCDHLKTSAAPAA